MKDIIICILVIVTLSLFQGYLKEGIKNLQKDKECKELNIKLKELDKREKEMLMWQEKLTTTENH